MNAKTLIKLVLVMIYLVSLPANSFAQVVYLSCELESAYRTETRYSIALDVARKMVIWFGKPYNIKLTDTRAEWITEQGFTAVLDRVTGSLVVNSGSYQLFRCVVTQKVF